MIAVDVFAPVTCLLEVHGCCRNLKLVCVHSVIGILSTSSFLITFLTLSDYFDLIRGLITWEHASNIDVTALFEIRNDIPQQFSIYHEITQVAKC